ncbi:hypothetical protein CASFOL_028676 [Castilleja foliolosa]|uniref:PUM-HD domain-containing protein n=1 Tax=Castilleja foliolosa TaxID=1961234 RepID=A0ABD3CBU2_9LAMI
MSEKKTTPTPSSTSKTLNKHGQNPSTDNNVADDWEETMAQYFSSLGLNDEYAPTYTNSVSAAQQQWLATNSVSHHNSIWGSPFFIHEGDYSGTRNNSVSNTDNFDHNSFSSSITPNYRRFRDTGNNGPRSFNRPADISPVIDIMRTLPVLKGDNGDQKKYQIYALISIVVKLMVDANMYCIFEALLDACDIKQMDALVQMIVCNSDSFLEAALCRQGVYSITRLIKRLKKSPHAFTLTRIFSTKFMDFMTHNTAKQVILTCFIYFSHESNQVLYEATICNCFCLATHKVGCIALNECMSTIVGTQRLRLLDNIAGISGILCDDPYGNYVLQVAMEQNFDDVNTRIFNRLRGRFVQLARTKIGSHIVEKCMKTSQDCMLSVISEMLRSPETLQVLAQHNFGNYVVQTALRMTREEGLNELYKTLVHSLEPHFPALMKTKGGRKVVELASIDRPAFGGMYKTCAHDVASTSSKR